MCFDMHIVIHQQAKVFSKFIRSFMPVFTYYVKNVSFLYYVHKMQLFKQNMYLILMIHNVTANLRRGGKKHCQIQLLCNPNFKRSVS